MRTLILNNKYTPLENSITKQLQVVEYKIITWLLLHTLLLFYYVNRNNEWFVFLNVAYIILFFHYYFGHLWTFF